METIAKVPKSHFLSTAEEIITRFITLPENPDPDRTGGYIAVMEKANQKMLLVNELGICLPEKVHSCFELCQEKVTRIHNRLRIGHFTSWQSRVFNIRKYGGGITAPENSQGIKAGHELIGSISGLVEHGDEAVTTAIWMVYRWIMLDDVRKIENISGNKLIMPLLKVCNDIFEKVRPFDMVTE